MQLIKFRRVLGALVVSFFVGLAASQVWIAFAQAGSTCSTSSPTTGGYSVTVCINAPAPNAIVTGISRVTATTTVTGRSPGVAKLIFYLDGIYLLTDFKFPYAFELPSQRFTDANRRLSVTAVLRDGFISNAASTLLRFTNGVTQPPVNNNIFTPYSPSALPLVVAATGDGASGETSEVPDRIATWNPSMFLYLGDVYENGTITEFHNWYGTATTFFGRFRGITNPVIGNHEHLNGIDDGYRNYWNNIPFYYSYNAAGWHFIALNSDSTAQTAPGSPQYQWLAQDLANNTAFCTIAYFHHPVYSVGPHGNTTGLNAIWSLLAQHGVDVVLTGHDHNYQRWRSLDGNGNANPQGITQFLVGGGGHGVRPFTRTDSRMAQGFDTLPNGLGALRMELNVADLTFQYINAAGTVLDSGTVPCRASSQITPLSSGVHDERSPNISYGGGWTAYNGTGPANNTLMYTNAQNAIAQFAFNGTGITLFRTLANNRGDMEMCIDTACQTISNNSATLQWNVPVTINLGSEATRTVRIRNLSTNYIDLDGVQVLAPVTPLGLGSYEETNANLTYTGTWTDYVGAGPRGGSFKYTYDPNARVSFSVVSTAERVIIYRTLYTGYGPVGVYVDGSFIGNMPTSTALTWSAPYVISLTPNGNAHSIELRNTSAQYVGFEAFDVTLAPPPPTPLALGSYEETNTNLTYTGNWADYVGAGPRGGSFKYTNDLNARVSFSVVSTAERVIIYRTLYAGYGPVGVYVDGSFIGNMPTSTTLTWSAPYVISLTPNGNAHSIELRNTSAQYVGFEAFDVALAPPPLGAGLYQETHPALAYSGTWTSYAGAGTNGGALVYTNDLTAQVSFRFSGQAFRIYRTLAFNRGPMTVCIDTITPCTVVSNYDSGVLWNSPVLIGNLGTGTHTVVIRNSSANTSQYLDVDAIEVFTTTPISLVMSSVTPSSIPTLVEVTVTPLPTDAQPTATTTPSMEASPEPSATPLPSEAPSPSPVPTEVAPAPEPTSIPLPTAIPTETPAGG